jgi:hypothetical protein
MVRHDREEENLKRRGMFEIGRRMMTFWRQSFGGGNICITTDDGSGRFLRTEGNVGSGCFLRTEGKVDRYCLILPLS